MLVKCAHEQKFLKSLSKEDHLGIFAYISVARPRPLLDIREAE